MYFAHSGKRLDRGDWQLLREHLANVAELAGYFAKPFGLERAAYFAGLYHDLGKYSGDFQLRLSGKDIRVDHSTAGAVEMLKTTATEDRDKAIADLIAYCIAGHHAGLPDQHNSSAACLERRLKTDLPKLDPVWKSELPQEINGLFPYFAKRLNREEAAFTFSVIGRMIFSCLVDADFKDTEAYYVRLDERRVDREWLPLQDLLTNFLNAFDKVMAGKKDLSNDLNRLRHHILSHVRAKASDTPGLFTLTVPTGGGKTLASLGFALDHARLHGHRRIIYAIPFTSVIDQTASIFRDILGADHVLEHHSAIDEEKAASGGPEGRQQRDKLKLAMEDWSAPVIVTTNVQFFESLFAAKPSRSRKLHNIAGSVIVLDEAQTIPRPLLRPAMRMLNELARNYGCSIVLCTATQPALDARKLEGGLPLAGRELAPDPQSLAKQLRRTSIYQVGELSNRDLCEALAQDEQVLVIVNCRKHALELYHEAIGFGLDGLIHLTTRQYAAHRRDIIKTFHARLKAGVPCRVIATSLIEAGVDVDFPKVWRAEAGLDQIIQAAGRCNREGHRPVEESIVSVFSAPDYPPPPEIRSLMGDMARMSARHEGLLSLAAIEDYFGEVYWRMGDQLDKHGIMDLFRLHRSGTDFAYRTAAEKFRMIESGMAPVIIDRDQTSHQAIAALGISEIPSGGIARRLQPYIVQVPPQARDLLIRNGHAAFVRPELREDQFAVLTNESLYEDDVGLVWEDAEYLATENSVI